jgi:hypothetical protein
LEGEIVSKKIHQQFQPMQIQMQMQFAIVPLRVAFDVMLLMGVGEFANFPLVNLPICD